MVTLNLYGGLALMLALAVYASYRSPAPDIGDFQGRPIVPWSYIVLAPSLGRASVQLSIGARRGLFVLAPRDRARCWKLFKIIVDVFRYAPERRESLERVLRVYAIEPSGRGPCTPSETDRLIAPKGDQSL